LTGKAGEVVATPAPLDGLDRSSESTSAKEKNEKVEK
jgi:hypothetical protein